MWLEQGRMSPTVACNPKKLRFHSLSQRQEGEKKRKWKLKQSLLLFGLAKTPGCPAFLELIYDRVNMH